MERKKLIVGNWKLNGTRSALEGRLKDTRSALRDTALDVALCVPFPFLESTERSLSGSHLDWGAQDLSQHEGGAHTGEVSARMLADYGCRYVIVGHSERRLEHAEDDRIVAAKVRAALAASLTPIICVGESWADREAGRAEKVVLGQVQAALTGLPPDACRACVLAYEPVWAIGTGRSASAAQAAGMHAEIRKHFETVQAGLSQEIRILYGGSVNPATARELFQQVGIDGSLVGGASLIPADFAAIVKAACEPINPGLVPAA